MIYLKYANLVMNKIHSINVKNTSKGPLGYYLGNDYKRDSKGRWCVECKMYLIEVVRRLKQFYGTPLCKKDISMVEGDHSEKNCSPLLDDAGH